MSDTKLLRPYRAISIAPTLAEEHYYVFLAKDKDDAKQQFQDAAKRNNHPNRPKALKRIG